MVATFNDTRKQFQGTIHMQTTVPADDQYDAAVEMRRVSDILQAAGFSVDAFNIPLVRDMQEEGDDKPTQVSTVLVAFEVSSPSAGTASCVANEVSESVQERSDVERYVAQLEQTRDSAERHAIHYDEIATGYRQAGSPHEHVYIDSANKQRAAAASTQSTIDTILAENENQFGQGRITNYTVLGIEAGVPLRVTA